MEWLEIHRPFSIHDVIAAATPHCLRNSFHNEQQCHLRIVKGAPQGWLEYASTATLNQTDKITLERKIRTIKRSTQSLLSENCHNAQAPSGTFSPADEGPGDPEQEKANNNSAKGPTSGAKDAGTSCVLRAHRTSLSSSQQPHEAATCGPYPADSMAEEDRKIQRTAGKRPDTQNTATGVNSHVFRHATWTQTEIECACPQQWRRTTHLNLLLVRDNEEVMNSGKLPTTPTTEAFQCPAVPPDQVARPQFTVTEVCVANADTFTAALIVGNAIAFNFANATSPGGGYTRGAFAQEEDLCRLLPQLYPSLKDCQAYPIRPDVALVTRNLLAVRHPGTYKLTALPIDNGNTPDRECNIMTAAMPGGKRDDPRHGSQEWIHTVRLRIRTVLHVARLNGFPNIILGAYGCGAFGNPPEGVAQMFVEQLQSPEFLGAFQRIVFAIIDPRVDGNLKVFRNSCARLFSEHRTISEVPTTNTPTDPTQPLLTNSTKRTSPVGTQHNKEKQAGATNPEDNRDAANEEPHAKARSHDTTKAGHLKDESVISTVNDPRVVPHRDAAEAADNCILASPRLEARQRRNNAIPYDPILGPFAPQHTNPTPCIRGTPATPALGSQHIGPDHHEHNTTAAGWLHEFQHSHRVTLARSRRRTDSMSPQRSESSSDDERPGYVGASANITIIFINMAGDTITQMVLNSSDTFVTVGHLYGHAKRHLQAREKDFSLVIGTHKLDNLSGRLFRIRPIQDAVRTSTNHTISLTLIRVQQVADPPAHQLDRGPRQLRFHVHRAPAWGNPRVAVLNLIPGQQQQDSDLPIYPITIRRIITAIEHDLDAQQRADFDTLARARPRQAMEQRAPNEQAQREQPASPTEPAVPHRRDLGPCCATKYSTTGSHAQPDSGAAAKQHTVTWWDDNHDGLEGTCLNDEEGPDSQIGRSSSASHAASSTETPREKRYHPPGRVQETHRPNTTWFKVVGPLPMPWLECTHPLCIMEITSRANPGCIQQANGGPFRQLRVISGATPGLLCQADVASFQVDAQIVLQRSVRAVGGAGRTRPGKDKDMLRDLDSFEHRLPQPKQAKDAGPRCLYGTALDKFKAISNMLPRESKTTATSSSRNLIPQYTTGRAPSQRGWTPAKQVTQTRSAGTNTPINATWIKVTGAIPMDWMPLPHPFGIADVTKTTESVMSKDQQAHKLCFAQLRIISGCNPARLTNSVIACLNQSNSVTFERSVRAAGGTKCESPRNLDHDANGTVTSKTDQVHHHTACTALSIKEGCSLRLGTPLFQILPLISEATDCAAFLTSWKPGSASDDPAVPIYHIEPDQHEPEDPLHRSTARALTTIAAHFQRDDELKETTLGATRLNQTAPLDEQASGISDSRQTHLPDNSQPRQWTPTSAPRQLTIACVEITDTLAEDVIHTATCLSINAIILLFHVIHHSDQSANSSRDINTRGHIPFASGPVSAPFTIQHRGPTEFQVACDAFGVGMHDSDYKIPDDPSESAAANQKTTNTSPRIRTPGHHTLQAALGSAQHSNTKSDGDNTHASTLSKDMRHLSPHISAQEHRTPPGILGIPQRTQSKADANKHWVPVQGNMNGSKSTHDQQDTQAPLRTRIEQNGKVRRSRSTVNQTRTPETTSGGSTGASIRGNTVKPTWRVKTADTKEATSYKPAYSNTHEAHRGIPPTPTPTYPTSTHPNHSTFGKPKHGNTTNQDGLHRVQPYSHDHNLKYELDSTTILHTDAHQALATVQMGTGPQIPVTGPATNDAAAAAQTIAPQRDALHKETHRPAQHASTNRSTKTYSHTEPEGEITHDPCISNISSGGMQPKRIKEFFPIDYPHQLPSVKNQQEHSLQYGQASKAMGTKSGSSPRRRQPPQTALLEPDTPLTAAVLAAGPPGLQKVMLGERLFPVIAKHQPELAGKITGMLLEMDNSDLLILLESEPQLNSKVDEATQALDTGDEANNIQPLALMHHNTKSPF